MLDKWINYHPCSVASEGYVFTGICLFNSRGEVWHQMHHGIGHMVRGGGPVQGGVDNTSPQEEKVIDLPPSPLDNTSPVDTTALGQHLPRGQNLPQEGKVIDLPPP